MNLQKNLVWINILIIFIFITAGALIAGGIFKKTSTGLEDKSIERNIGRVNNLLIREISLMEQNTYDYANWDDSYLFMQDNTTYYISAGGSESAITNLGIDTLAFFDMDFKMHYRYSELEEDKDIEISRILEFISMEKITEKSGYVTLDSGVLLFSITPIRDTKELKDPNGYLFFCRYLGESQIEEIKELIQLEVNFFKPSELENQVTEELKNGVYNQRGKTIKSYVEFPSSIGENFVVVISQSREIHESYLENIYFLYLFFGITFIILILVVYLFNKSVSYTITLPLKKLNESALAISSGNLEGKINADYPIKEINELANSVESMRVSLKKSRDELEKKVEARTNELNKRNKEYEKSNKFMLNRELKMIELKKKIREQEDKKDE